MHAEEPQSNSVSGSALSPPPSAAPVAQGIRLPLWLLTVGAGLVAGLLAGQGGEAIDNAIPLKVELPPDFASMGGYQKNAVSAMAQGKAMRIGEQKKAAAAYGLLGALLGLTLGLIGGLAVGSPRSGFVSAVIGITVGAAAGAGISFAAVPVFFRYQDPEFGGFLGLFLTHAAIFAGVGAAAGLALGYGLGDRPALGRALFGGLLGGLVGTFVFETVNSLAFPLMRTFEPIPSERLPRILVHLCIAVCAALIAGLAVGTLPRKEPTRLVE
jgi:hypothetical protein